MENPQLHFLAVQGSFDFYNIYNIIVLKEEAKSQQGDLFFLDWPFFLILFFFFFFLKCFSMNVQMSAWSNPRYNAHPDPLQVHLKLRGGKNRQVQHTHSERLSVLLVQRRTSK